MYLKPSLEGESSATTTELNAQIHFCKICELSLLWTLNNIEFPCKKEHPFNMKSKKCKNLLNMVHQ